ncbi:MAG: hypothetical protein JWN81_2890 [Solirubrobacterales bacterium]|jgi:hypothetical protein|nr:hypothetical protein [Solirubrobacterales bacterium]
MDGWRMADSAPARARGAGAAAEAQPSLNGAIGTP